MNGKILANLRFFVTLQMPSDEFIALFKIVKRKGQLVFY